MKILKCKECGNIAVVYSPSELGYDLTTSIEKIKEEHPEIVQCRKCSGQSEIVDLNLTPGEYDHSSEDAALSLGYPKDFNDIVSVIPAYIDLLSARHNQERKSKLIEVFEDLALEIGPRLFCAAIINYLSQITSSVAVANDLLEELTGRLMIKEAPKETIH